MVTSLSSFAPASLAMTIRVSAEGAACSAASGASNRAVMIENVRFMG